MQVTCSFLLSSSMRALSLSASFNISLFLQTMRSSILFPTENPFQRIFRFWNKSCPVGSFDHLLLFCKIFLSNSRLVSSVLHKKSASQQRLHQLPKLLQEMVLSLSLYFYHYISLYFCCSGLFITLKFSSLWKVTIGKGLWFFFFIVFVFLNPFVNVIILLVGLCFLIPLIKCLNHHWDCSRAVFPIFH